MSVEPGRSPGPSPILPTPTLGIGFATSDRVARMSRCGYEGGGAAHSRSTRCQNDSAYPKWDVVRPVGRRGGSDASMTNEDRDFS